MRVFLTSLLLIAAIALNTLSVSSAASAAEFYGYAYVDEGVTAYFCEEPDVRKSIFAVPETYCVTVINEYNDDWYYVRYAEDDGVYVALYGYIKQSDVIITDQPLENTYLHMTVKIIYSSENVDGMSSLPPIELTAAVYGSYSIGGTDCTYMYCNGSFGYYPQTYDYPHNELPATQTFTESAEEYDAKAITAVVITVLAVFAIVILYLSGKHKRPNE